MDPTLVWSSIAIPGIIGLISFCCFFWIMDHKYHNTFFTTLTGSQFACLNFKLALADEEKFGIFGSHPSYSKAINGELKIWLADNWGKWNSEKPVWFTDAAIEQIPNELAPKPLIDKFGGNRKDSVQGFSVAIRASLNMFQGHTTRDNNMGLNRIVISGNDNILASDSNVARVTVRSRDNNLLVRRVENDVDIIAGVEGAEKEPEEEKVAADIETGNIGLFDNDETGVIDDINIIAGVVEEDVESE